MFCEFMRELFRCYVSTSANIIHTRLRHNCVLNIDLFRCNIIDSPLCSCGKPEDTYHYFFNCNKYAIQRNELFNSIFRMKNLCIVGTHALFWGDNSLSDLENKHLFQFEQIFIKKFGRFSWFIFSYVLYVMHSCRV